MGFYDIEVKDIDGQNIKLSKYKGKVVLIVNVASRCGFTKQYKELEALYKKYKEDGFVILGFPCNQFLYQEPGDEQTIKTFCQTKYDVSFDLFSKVKVGGKEICPLYEYLINAKPWSNKAKAVKWNFEKFLITRDGEIENRYASKITPFEIEEDIRKLLD